MKFLFSILTCFLFTVSAQAQQINFSAYADYGLEIINSPQDLNFNQVGPIIADGSTYSLDIHEGNFTIIEIVGVKYLDIYVDVTADDNMIGNNTGDAIDFTLKAAYSNQLGDVKDPASIPLKYINVMNDAFNIRTPILERQSQPPNPPPTPPTNATDLDPRTDYSNPLYETFYLYLYGDITVPEGTSADSYTGNITVTVSYD
ncbi:hypothetical protein [Fodinibius sp. Rm-B-1B1-1]|uniref:hypothetical protein n=1 Tax=Fodinibius alkaliphilus TaxID=3140241 RepID=UPI00315A659F